MAVSRRDWAYKHYTSPPIHLLVTAKQEKLGYMIVKNKVKLESYQYVHLWSGHKASEQEVRHRYYTTNSGNLYTTGYFIMIT